ncbi:uncharacterized protein LOC122163342 [Centrocercus urophasianus]|uniref:uncharacterized protein LOC122163342 n=1 Tax=Centrocercus urophasianus TaxID=9002 RepID=UPI001C64C3E7|nr:uncharacterized protein LOC122163342 [Centrocercus urophasianus]
MSKQRRLTTSPVAAAAPEDDWGVSKDDLHASLMGSLFSRPFHVTDPVMNAQRLHCTTLLILSELPSLPNGGQTLRQQLFGCLVLSSFCGLDGSGASRVTHLGYATSLGFLLSLSRERLHTVADPTGRQCVWPAPGTTQTPGAFVCCNQTWMMQRNGSPLKTLQTAGGHRGKGRFPKQLLAIIGSNNLKSSAFFPLILSLMAERPDQTAALFGIKLAS